jgi:hypothetical protein
MIDFPCEEGLALADHNLRSIASARSISAKRGTETDNRLTVEPIYSAGDT